MLNLHHTQYTELLLPGAQSSAPHTQSFTAHLRLLNHTTPGKALCFFSSVHRDSASRNTELLPRGNTVLNLHHTQYTELMLSSGMLPPTKPLTPSKALCFFSSVHRASASRNTELHPRWNTELQLSAISYTELHRSSPPTKTHTPSKALCFFIPLSQSYHLPEHKACNHTQSFSPAGTQCLTSIIHNTQGLCYLPGCFRPQSPTPQAKLCASSPPCTELLLPGTQSFTSHPSR